MILEFVRSGTPPVDPYASEWAGCPHSLMDLAGSGPYSQIDDPGGKIRRADAWRLLFLPPSFDDDQHYNQYPFSPWEPVRTTTVQNSASRIRNHIHYSKHHLSYQHWIWQLRNKSTLQDQGFNVEPIQLIPPNVKVTRTLADFPTVPLLSDQDASQSASSEVFRWVTANGEGVPPSEAIYHDDWLHEYTSTEASSLLHDNTSDSRGSVRSNTISRSAIDPQMSSPNATSSDVLSPSRKLNIESWFQGL